MKHTNQRFSNMQSFVNVIAGGTYISHCAVSGS
jgi:hypothetical protein